MPYGEIEEERDARDVRRRMQELTGCGDAADCDLRLSENAGKPYKPSNGTEGDAFEARFCDRCIHERDMRNNLAKYGDPMDEEGCDILCRAQLSDPGDAEFPVEWIYGEDGRPQCTAFQMDDGEEPHYKAPDETHGDLFAGSK